MNSDQSRLLEQVYLARGPLLGQINRAAPWHALYRRRTLANLLPAVVPDGRVLDLAGGTGIFAKVLAPLVRQLTLVDCLPSMVDLAKKVLVEEDHNKNVDFVLADITSSETHFEVRHYDLAILTQALNFCSVLEPIFSLASRSLKPAGVFYLDTDTQLRWAAVEALTGHLDNALAIIIEAKDTAKHIVGTEYKFHTTDEILEAASNAGFTLRATSGICHIACLIHIFNQSSDFLTPEILDPRSARMLSEEALDKLYRLDSHLESMLPSNAGGWSTFTFVREEEK